MWLRAAKHAGTLVATVLLAGLLGAVLVRLAPGFDVDERTMDARYSASTLEAIRQQHSGDRAILSYYGHYLGGAVRGDFGMSRMLNRPIADLLRDRGPVTAASIAYGVLGGWLLGFPLAIIASRSRARSLDLASTAVSGFFLCVPAAVLALAFLILRAPGRLAIALIIFPKIFRYSKNLLDRSVSLPHVITARAKGLHEGRILLAHVLPTAAPELFALLGVSVSIAFGAAIPVEVICDSPGIGQLAWQAALARDLPLLVTVTLLVTMVTMAANSGADLAGYAVSPERR